MTTNGDHLAATSTKRGGVRMHVLHWKPMTWSLDVMAALPFVVSRVRPAASAAVAG
jgi:hypothetical protein